MPNNTREKILFKLTGFLFLFFNAEKRKSKEKEEDGKSLCAERIYGRKVRFGKEKQKKKSRMCKKSKSGLMRVLRDDF